MATEILSLEVREDGSRVVKRNITAIGKAANDADGKVTKFSKDLQSMKQSISPINQVKRALVSLGGVVAFGALIRSSFAFGDAMAEVSTLVDETVFNMDLLTEAAKEQAVAFGSNPVAQSKALYQVISAGAKDSAEAIDILSASNKLAVGGVTDIATAADGLTSVLNAYGDGVKSATDVSDTLFIGMRAGKTTIGELSASLGQVAPLAESLGVPFDELVASVSALTKGGINTTRSITGVRAILASIAKPSAEASKLAQQLGIDFSVAGIKAEGGFGGFLQKLNERTGGSKQALTQLFGGVEALVPVLAFAGGAGESFNEIMEDMAKRTGATEDAFNKISATPGQNFRKLMAAMQVNALSLGTVLADALNPALKFLAENFSRVTTAGAAFASVFVVSKVLSFAAGIKSISGALTIMRLAILANPLGLLLTGLASATAALVYFKDEIKFGGDDLITLGEIAGATFSIITDQVTIAANYLQSAFVQAVNSVQLSFSEIPSSFSDILTSAKTFGNNLIAGFVATFGALGVLLAGSLANVKALFTGGDLIPIADIFLDAKSQFDSDINEDYFGAIEGALDGTFERIKARAIELRGVVAEANGGASGAPDNDGGVAKEIVESSTRLTPILDEINAQLTEQAGLLRLNSREREIQSRFNSTLQELADANENITASEKEALATRIKSNFALEETAGFYAQLSQPFQDIQDSQRILNSLLDAGTISQNMFNASMSELINQQAALNIQSGEGSFMDGYLTTIQSMTDATINFTATAGEKFGGFTTTLSEGFSKASADALLFGDSFKESFGTVARQALSSLTAGLIQMGVQMLINQTIGQAAQAASTASGAAQASALAASWAPAASFASLASFGANAAPANAAIVGTVGLAQGLTAARRLGGDLNAGQMSRVGEGDRNELFTGRSGKQMFIPAERGRVDPLTPAPAASAPSGGGGSGRSEPVVLRVFNILDPSLLGQYLNSEEGSTDYLNYIEKNASDINANLGN